MLQVQSLVAITKYKPSHNPKGVRKNSKEEKLIWHPIVQDQACIYIYMATLHSLRSLFLPQLK